MSSINVDQALCVGCGLCVKACPFGAIVMEDKSARITEACTLCGACVASCKFDAIILRQSHEAVVNLDDYHGVWVIAEQRQGILQRVALELLGAGRELAAALETDLTAILLGSQVGAMTSDLISHGADRVIVIDDPQLEHYRTEPYTAALTELVGKYRPEIIIGGASTLGRDLLPRAAVRLRTGLTADCTGLAIDEEKHQLLQTRPAFGGNIMATIVCPRHRPQMATVRPHVMKPLPPDPARTGEIITAAMPPCAGGVRFLEMVCEECETVNLSESNIIVAGGRGMVAPDNFKMLSALAKVLGASVGASRAAVDSGWIPYSHQVGQTGKTVQPKLYVACGISGAVQHLVGMQSSDFIIAINKDPHAPIFNVADIGIVGDLFEIIPRLIKQLQKE